MLSLMISLWVLGQVHNRQVASPLPCVTAADSAESLRMKFDLLTQRMDSVGLAQIELPYRPATGVKVIQDEDTCRAGIRAFNALYPDRQQHIKRAVVLRVGSDRYVLWGVRYRSGRGRHLQFVFDLNWHLVKLLV
jgi:hypothetical protein